MISDERLNHLIFAADHHGLCDITAVKYVHGGGPEQVTLSCYELKELLGAYLERRTTAGNNEESVQDRTGTTDEVSK